MNNTYLKGIFSLLVCLLTINIANAQDDCVPTPGAVIVRGGTINFNYGSTTNAVNSKKISSIILGEPVVGQANNTKYTVDYGFYAQFLLAPQAPAVIASQGEYLDRIEVKWDANPLGGSSTGGFNIYRDSIFIASVGPKVRNFNDFNVIAGRPYTYTVTGLNDFGEGYTGSAVGFMVPNGVVTGLVETPNGNPVIDAIVSLNPQQGFSAAFGPMDGASSLYNASHPFLPNGNFDWTISFWIKTNAATGGKGVFDLENNLSFVALESSQGNGITFNAAGGSLTAPFPNGTMSEWHHIAVTHHARDNLTGIYLDGDLQDQKVIPVTIVPTSLNLGARTLTGGGWNGYLDELRIYHKVVKEVDIQKSMNVTATFDEEALSHYWKFDEQLGVKSYDIMSRDVMYFCGVDFSTIRPFVSTAAMTNEEGYYRIEGVSYGTGQTFIAKPSKDFYSKRALEFNIQDQSYAALPAWSLNNTATLELWFNCSNNPTMQTLVSKKFGTDEFKISVATTGNQRNLIVSTDQGSIQANNVSKGYHHLAVTFNGSNVSLYIDGVSAASGNLSLSNIGDANYKWILGASNGGAQNWFSGFIDEIAVYNNVQTSTQIQTHFQAGRTFPDQALSVYFQLDEGSGNKVNNIGSLQLLPGDLYGTEWTSFAPMQQTTPHEFSPRTRQVTLNPSVTSVDRIDFIDKSTIPVSGYVRFNNTDCFQKNVEILVNGVSFSPPVYTDSIGKFVIDLDPGFSGTLTPKYSDHVFFPPVYEVINVVNPIAGIVFYNVESRKISGKVVGGDEQCNKSIIQNPGTPQGTVCIVKVSTPDNCLQRTMEILTTDGEYTFDNLPPVERMIVSVIEHSDPEIKTAFQVQGGKTANLVDRDTVFDFRYYAEPQVEVISGLEPFSNDCPLIVWEKGNTQQLVIKVKEQYPTIPLEEGVCYLDTANFKIVNGVNEMTLDTAMHKMSNKKLSYSFEVGEPNPSPPYLKTITILARSESSNESEFTAQVLVLGYKAKANTFTTITPETPSIVLRDPPGDASYAYIEKNTNVCTNVTLFSEKANGNGATGVIDLGPDQDIVAGPVILTFESDLGGEFVGTQTITKSSSNAVEICTSFSEVISTSDDENFIGGDGDIFVGGALNVDYGNVDVISFDTANCVGAATQTVLVVPGSYATQFIYSKNNIVKNIIPGLIKLRDLSIANQDMDEVAKYNTSIARWNQIIANNEETKSRAATLRNISFDGGITYENAITSDTSETKTVDELKSYVNNQDIHVLFSINGLGGGTIIHVINEGTDGKSSETNSAKGITVGYALHDDDPLDAFSVEIGMDSFYNTPIFRTKVGQSSCPWEPNTAKREGMNMEIGPDGPVRVDVPANEPAVYHLLLGNASETNEEVTALLTMDNATNPYGAKVFCNGVSLSQGLEYTIPYGESIPVTLTIEKGPIEYDYDSLVVALSSLCQNDDPAFYDPIALYAHFIKPCSEVAINVPEQNWVVFPNPLTTGDDDVRQITVSGYDTTATEFKLIRVQYRPSNGDGAWINIQTESGTDHEVYNGNWAEYDNLPAPKPPVIGNRFHHFFWNTTGLADGEYEIRALTECSGDAANRPGYSQVIKGKIDRQPPRLLGVPQPSDGVYHVGDEISFTFNQAINCNKLIQADINNANNVGLYYNNTLIDVKITCHDNKIVLDPTFDNEYFENKILRAELHNIEDLVGNKNFEEEWEFYVDRNELAWLEDSLELVKFVDEEGTMVAKIHNRGGYPVPFNITAPAYIHVTPDRGTLVANEEEEIRFTVDDNVAIGNYIDSIILHTETGLNPFFMGGDEILIMNTRVICRPPNWVLNPSGFDPSDFSYSMNMVVNLDIEGDLSTDKEDIVGAYVDGELRGIAKIRHNPAFNNYVAFLTVYSNEATGENVTFQIWDASACRLFARAIEEFPFVADDLIGSALNPQTLHTNGNILRRIYIHPGWNWISMNLEFPDNNVDVALESLSNPTGALIKEQTTFSVYLSTAQSWLGSMKYIFPYSLYQYHSLSYDSLLMVGAPIDVTTPIPLYAGWNWIGYLPQTPLPINQALASLNPSQGDIIKGQLSFAQYFSGPGWVGDLQFLDAPNGYLLKLANADTLSYPNVSNVASHAGSERSQALVDEASKTSVDELSSSIGFWQVNPSQFEHTMNMIALVSAQDPTANLLGEGDEVAAFVGNEIRGTAKAIYIPALQSYMLFMTVYSNKGGENLTFKFFDASENNVYPILETHGFDINGVWGSIDQPVALHLNSITFVSDYEANKSKVSVYPNPFSNVLNIKYASERAGYIELIVADPIGNIVENRAEAIKHGINHLEWRPKAGTSGGTYFLTIVSEDKVETHKVLLIK